VGVVEAGTASVIAPPLSSWAAAPALLAGTVVVPELMMPALEEYQEFRTERSSAPI
jgi:hypothetical protein